MSDRGPEARRQDAVLDVAHSVVVASLMRQLHSRDSAYVQAALAEVLAALSTARRYGIESPFSLQFDDTRLYHEGLPLDGPSLQARHLLSRCSERQIAALTLSADIAADELNRLFDLLLLPQNRDALSRQHRDTTLHALGIRHAQVMLRTPGDPADRRAAPDDAALRHYQELADALQQNHRLAHRDLELEVDATCAAVESTLLDLDEPSMLLSLALQDDVDRFTVGHSVRVALLALQVARSVGVTREQLVRIGTAALMHDIGKSKVPPEVLFKQGRLDMDEWRWMTQHPRLGAQLLIEQHDRIDPSTVGAAFCHHMAPGGLGYPRPAVPIEPSGTSKLIRVCDVFEALTAVRPYKLALTPIESFAVMFRNEGEFDPRWLRRFVRTIGLFPNGTRVRLDCGSDAVVTAQTDDLTGPMVRVISGPDGADLPAGHPGDLRIGVPFEGAVPRIAGVATPERHVHVPEQDEAPGGFDRTVHTACFTPGTHDGHHHDHG